MASAVSARCWASRASGLRGWTRLLPRHSHDAEPLLADQPAQALLRHERGLAVPFAETDKADGQLTIYAATKKATESMSHAYAHLWNLPTTMFRFFTVYGTWGRPDLAYFKFVDAILNDRPIDIYNHGDMWRDFTSVDDLVRGIRLLIDVPPVRPLPGEAIPEGDSLSPNAPWRVVNIGNSDKVRLLDFVEVIEDVLGRRAIRNYMPMQMGDVPATWADAGLLQRLTGYRPQTKLRDGMVKFVTWYREYYGK